MEAPDQYTLFKNHAATFPKESLIWDSALIIPGIQIIAYEILLYRYQDNPLARDDINALKNRMQHHFIGQMRVTSFACIAMAGLSAAGISVPSWASKALMVNAAATFAHFLGRNVLHRGWNCVTISCPFEAAIYKRNGIEYIFGNGIGHIAER